MVETPSSRSDPEQPEPGQDVLDRTPAGSGRDVPDRPPTGPARDLPDRAPTGPDRRSGGAEPGPTGFVDDDRDPRTPGRLRSAVWPVLGFLALGVLTVAAHLLAAFRPGAPVATIGEARLAVAAVVARGAELAAAPLPIADRLATFQLAVVQTLLPLGDASVVDAARWACLALGAVAALLVWPVLRGLEVSVPASVLGTALVGVALPALWLHSGITAAAPAAVWLTLAAVLAVRGWGRTAVLAALLAVLTAPLAAAALLALTAHVVLGRMTGLPTRWRLPVGGLLAVAAVAVAALCVGSNPLAGTTGPGVATPFAVAAVVGGLLIVGLAWWTVEWLRPVLTAAALLLVVGVVPGPSRSTAALLVAPALAVALGLLADRVGEWLSRRTLAAVGVFALLAGLVGPTPIALLARPVAPDEGGLVAWLQTEPDRDAVVQADDLDRAELLAAGFPAGQLRPLDGPAAAGALRLVADRPGGGAAAPRPPDCAGAAVVAASPHATGGAPGAICRTDGGAATVAVEAPARTRLGAALAQNPSLQLTPAAAATLREGRVDPRLMLVLVALSTAHQVSVDDFPAVEFDTADLPRRRVLISSVDGNPPATSELLQTWLAAQQPPFVPSFTRSEGPALLVSYSTPPAGGLIPE